MCKQRENVKKIGKQVYIPVYIYKCVQGTWRAQCVGLHDVVLNTLLIEL